MSFNLSFDNESNKFIIDLGVVTKGHGPAVPSRIVLCVQFEIKVGGPFQTTEGQTIYDYLELTASGRCLLRGEFHKALSVREVANLFPEDEQIWELCKLLQPWLLNGSRLGTKAQISYLKGYQDCFRNAVDITYPEPPLQTQQKFLGKAQLLEDNGHYFGKCELVELLPLEVYDQVVKLITTLQSR